MFIICPKCSAKYKIPEGIQLESGQKLKCSACNFIFVKGEEEPFVLEKPLTDTESAPTAFSDSVPPLPPEPKMTESKAFSEPLYTTKSQSSSADSLPEAFKPVEATPPTPKKKVGFIILIYLILIAVLCAAGWAYRDSLKPSFKGTFPALYPSEEKLPPKMKQNALPIRAQRPAPVNQPTVAVEELPQISNKNGNAQTQNQDKSTPRKEKTVAPKAVTAPIVQPKPAVQKPVQQDSQQPVVKAPIVQVVPESNPLPVEPAPVTVTPELSAPAPTPVLPEPIIVPEAEVIPLFETQEPSLFEVVDTPLPSATGNELTVGRISFRIEPTEENIDQVLIEGQIQNIAPQKRSVPLLTILAMSRDGQILAQKKVHTAVDSLESGETTSFYTSLMPAPINLDHIEVQF